MEADSLFKIVINQINKTNFKKPAIFLAIGELDHKTAQAENQIYISNFKLDTNFRKLV